MDLIHLQTLLKPFPSKEKKRIKEVFQYGLEHLGKQMRRSGESYAQHGLEVATTLHEGMKDPSLVRVALLHDLLIHPKGQHLLKQSPLSSEERRLSRKMHQLRRLHIDSETSDLDRVIDAFLSDERLVFLRMAHRLNDVRHIDRFQPEHRSLLASETLHMYTALAERLGMHLWRLEMEDVCFEICYPEACHNLRQKFDQMQPVDEACLKQSFSYIQKNLSEGHIRSRLEKRVKTLYSTYRKMVVKNRSFEDLTDRLAIRVIVKNQMDCYRALGVIHQCLHPVPGKLKDYIGAPKENGYQSIHTVVYPMPGVTEIPIEVQIRSEAMHRHCEFGPASHFDYKKGMYALRSGPARVNLFRNLQSLRHQAESPKEFESVLRKYFREDQMAIFDSQSNLYHMKKPSTALEFVEHVYPNRAKRLKLVRVNGRQRSVDVLLNDGDTVEAKFGRKAL